MATRKVTTSRKRKFVDPLEPPPIINYRGMKFIVDAEHGMPVKAAFDAVDVLITSGHLVTAAIILIVNESPVPHV